MKCKEMQCFRTRSFSSATAECNEVHHAILERVAQPAQRGATGRSVFRDARRAHGRRTTWTSRPGGTLRNHVERFPDSPLTTTTHQLHGTFWHEAERFGSERSRNPRVCRAFRDDPPVPCSTSEAAVGECGLHARETERHDVERRCRFLPQPWRFVPPWHPSGGCSACPRAPLSPGRRCMEIRCPSSAYLCPHAPLSGSPILLLSC